MVDTDFMAKINYRVATISKLYLTAQGKIL